MDVVPEIEKLQAYSDYRAARKILRWSSLVYAFLGLWSIAVGCKMLSESSLAYGVLAAGGFLVFSTIYVLFVQSEGSALMLACAQILLGIMTVILAVNSLVHGRYGSALILGFVGLVYVVWGIGVFDPESALKGIALAKPPDDAMAELDRLVAEIRRAREKQGEECFELVYGTRSEKKYYRGKVMGDVAFMADSKGLFFRVVHAVDFEVTLAGETLEVKDNRVRVRVRDKETEATMSAVSYERIKTWRERSLGAAEDA